MIKLLNSPEKCRNDGDSNSVSSSSKDNCRDNDGQGEMRNTAMVLCASQTFKTQLESNCSSTDQDGSENNVQYKENANIKVDNKTADSERKSMTEGCINLKSDDTYSSSKKQQTSSTCKSITTDANTDGSTDSSSGQTKSASESNMVNSKERCNGEQTELNNICLEKQKDKCGVDADGVLSKSSGDACKSSHKSKRNNSDSKKNVDQNRRRESRRSRSVSTDYERKRSKHSKNYDRHKRNRSKSLERRNGRQSRSASVDYEKKRTRNSNNYDDRYKHRRSKSLERRREERKRRHAERRYSDNERSNHVEKRKRNQPDDHNQPSDSKSSSKTGTSSPNQIDVDNITVTNPQARITERQRRTVDLLTSRTGGAYIPPAKLRLMQAEITDKSSAAYQRIAWEALKKSIHGFINKVNVDNIAIITRELLRENIIRGRGLLCRSIIQAQAASPTFTHVYAALVSIINSKFPNIGLLLLKRLVIQFKRAFRRNDKMVCLSATRFIAHLMNQRVSHEILALEILTLLVETPTDDSVEVAIAFLKECGMKLTEVTSKGIGAIFEMLKNILHEGKLDKRVQYMIEVVFQVRKDGFKDHQSVIESLELVEENDQLTHLLMLDDAVDPEDALNAFKFDEQYEANEDKYKGLSREILGSDESDSNCSGSDNSESGSSTENDSDDSDNDDKGKSCEIIDNTETNLIALRRTIYLTINSSLDYEECAHKLMKMQLKPGQEIELCHMFLDCCAEQRTYEKFYGLLAQRFCAINKIYIEPFEEIFKDTYKTTHRLDTNRLRNVSKFFAHLLFTDAIGWDVFDCIKLNEEDTTSSSRIFIKILFQELAEYMGLSELNKKLKDEVLEESLAGLFPKDNPRNTRFSINFFTSIGLGGLTDELRQFLKNAPKSVPAVNAEILANKPIKESSSSSTSTSSSSDSSSSSGSESSSSSSPSDNSSSDDSLDTSALMSSSSSHRKSHENKPRKKKGKLTINKNKCNNKREKSKACKVNQNKQKAKKAEISPGSKSSLSTSDNSSDSNTDTSSGSSSDSSSDHKSIQARRSPTRAAKIRLKPDNRVNHEEDRRNHMKKSINAKKESVNHAERKSGNDDTNREMELRRRRDEREKRHREKDKEEQRLHDCDLKRDSNLEHNKKRERKQESCRELQNNRSPTNSRRARSKGRKVRHERERHRSGSRSCSRSRSRTRTAPSRCQSPTRSQSRGHRNTFVNKSR